MLPLRALDARQQQGLCATLSLSPKGGARRNESLFASCLRPMRWHHQALSNLPRPKYFAEMLPLSLATVCQPGELGTFGVARLPCLTASWALFGFHSFKIAVC